jgi:hypothetical protein
VQANKILKDAIEFNDAIRGEVASQKKPGDKVCFMP